MSKNYHELVKKRIYIGGVNDIDDVIENEQIDIVFDLRAEVSDNQTSDYNRVHSPIVDDATQQDQSLKKAINHVVNAYNKGGNIYFHCKNGSNRTGAVVVGTLLTLKLADTIVEAEKMAQDIRPQIDVKPQMKEAIQRIFPNA